ncbi:type VI secretion system protein TssL, partial [Rhizobium leguminosarum]
MKNEPASTWQNLPTIVELTEDCSRKKQSARKMAEMLYDVLDFPESEGGKTPAVSLPKGAASVETLVRDFRFGA